MHTAPTEVSAGDVIGKIREAAAMISTTRTVARMRIHVGNLDRFRQAIEAAGVVLRDDAYGRSQVLGATVTETEIVPPGFFAISHDGEIVTIGRY